MTREDYLAWKAHPVTEWVLKAVRTAALLQQEEWTRLSWEQGRADPLALTELRTRADSYVALDETPYETWAGLNGDPVTE